MRQLRERIPLTQDQAAERSTLSMASISRIERVVTHPDEIQGTTLTLLAQQYMRRDASGEDLVALWKENGSGKKPDKKKGVAPKGIPVMGNISASGLVDFMDDRHHEADEFVPAPTPYVPDAFALRIKGDSMKPKYEPGDRVIFEPCACDDVHPGEDCMVQLTGDGDSENTFKRVYPSPTRGKGWLFLLPLNNGHPPIEVECEKVIRIARAVAIHRPIQRPPGR